MSTCFMRLLKKTFNQSLILPPSLHPWLAAASASICVGAKGASPSILERKAVLQLLKEHHIAEENFSSANEKDLRVGRGTRAFLHGTRPRTRAYLHVRSLYEGGSQRAEGRRHEGTLHCMSKALPGRASQFKLPCEVFSHKVCPARFGAFAL